MQVCVELLFFGVQGTLCRFRLTDPCIAFLCSSAPCCFVLWCFHLAGGWLVLKNVHLAVSWLPNLEKELYTLTKHENFRLFLTSEPHNKFPTTLLEGSLKVGLI